jgi:hypothetical protein
MGLVSSNTSCAAAQHAALACRPLAWPLAQATPGDCRSAGISWNCDRAVYYRGAPYVLTCDEDIKTHYGDESRPRGFMVRWNAFSPRT